MAQKHPPLRKPEEIHLFPAKLWAKREPEEAWGLQTCEYLQPDLGQGGQRGLVEDADVANLLHLRRVHAFAPDGLEDVPHRRRLLKRTLQEIWHGEKRNA